MKVSKTEDRLSHQRLDIFLALKVSKFQKDNLVSSNLPKNKIEGTPILKLAMVKR